MKIKTLYEASLFDGSELITEEMLTESFIEDTLKPQLLKLFTVKAKRAHEYEVAMKRYVQELNAMGFNGNEVREIAERKARAIRPENIKTMFSKQLNELFIELKEGGLPAFTIPALTLIAILYLNGAFSSLFVGAFGESLGRHMSATLIAPLTEETGRWINIRMRQGGQYTVMLNMAEYTIYVMRAISAGTSLPWIMTMRGISVISHTLATVIMRSGVQGGSKVLQALPYADHALWNYFTEWPLRAIAVAVVASEDRSDINDTTRMFVYGHNGPRDENEIRLEIAAKSPTLIMIQKGIDSSFVKSYASKISAKIVYWVSFTEVQKAYNENKKLGKIAVIIDDHHLVSDFITGGGSIRQWLRKSIYIKIIRAAKPEKMEA